MNHKLYEDWLFAKPSEDWRTADLPVADETLTSQEAKALQEHLSACESCQQLSHAWRELDTHLTAAPLVGPAPGFTSRFQLRLEAERRRIERRQSFVVLGFSVAGAVLALGSLAVLFWPWLKTPSALMWAGAYRLFSLAWFFEAVGDFFTSLAVTMASVISPLWFILFVGLVCELAVLWVVSLRLLTNPRRIIQ